MPIFLIIPGHGQIECLQAVARASNTRPTMVLAAACIRHSALLNFSNVQRHGTGRTHAAIFCADVADYSRLMHGDDIGTLRNLTRHRAIMDGPYHPARGRIANTAGDSVLAEFPSVVDAVERSVAVQERLGEANAGVDDHGMLRFRIGVHVGDVMVQGRDLLGDGVNVAARVQWLAEPRAVCISGARVLGALAPNLEKLELARAKAKPTASLDAYDLTLRAHATLRIATRETARALPARRNQQTSAVLTAARCCEGSDEPSARLWGPPWAWGIAHHLFVAIDHTSKFAFVELHEKATTRVSADFLRLSSKPCPTSVWTRNLRRNL